MNLLYDVILSIICNLTCQILLRESIVSEHRHLPAPSEYRLLKEINCKFV